jgi:very-long-chain (3R)-3-hydroxyacyl-CoA dehydratase
MALSARHAYLLAYNLVQCSLWLNTARLLVLHVSAYVASTPAIDWLSPAGLSALYGAVSPWALNAQRLSWLEVAHAAVGLAGGRVGTAFVQALGRSAVLLVLVEAASSARGSVPAVVLIAAATASDLVRYLFYATKLVGVCPRWLLVARYSVFLLFYPVGIACEWLLYFVALEEVDALQIGRIAMPNTYNFAFDYGLWNRAVLVAYAYFGPSMFLYMLGQRRKQLGPALAPVALKVR